MHIRTPAKSFQALNEKVENQSLQPRHPLWEDMQIALLIGVRRLGKQLLTLLGSVDLRMTIAWHSRKKARKPIEVYNRACNG